MFSRISQTPSNGWSLTNKKERERERDYFPTKTQFLRTICLLEHLTMRVTAQLRNCTLLHGAAPPWTSLLNSRKAFRLATMATRAVEE